MREVRQILTGLRSLRLAVTGGGADFIRRRREFLERRGEIERAVVAESRTDPSLFREGACAVCGERAPAETFTNPVGFSFGVCSNDGTVYMDPVPTDATLSRLYNERAYAERWNDDGAADGRAKRPKDKDLEALLGWIGVPSDRGRLLDVGCASGRFLEQAAAHFDASGVELGESAALEARRRGFDVTRGDISDLPGADVYDVVTMLQLIEHLPRPDAALESARRLLKPGGYLLVSTPTAESASFRYLKRLHRHVGGFAHVELYTESGLARLVEDRGLRRVAHENWGRKDLALHDVVSRRVSERRYFQGMALFSPRLYHASNFVDGVLLGLPSRITVPDGIPPYQRALFRKPA